MLTFYIFTDDGLKATQNKEEAVWVHAELPTDDEFDELQRHINIPQYLIKDVQDPDEMPHMDLYDGNEVLFFDIPVETDSVPLFQTRPLCLIMTEKRLITITYNRYPHLDMQSIDYMEHPESVTDLLVIVTLQIMASYIATIRKMEDQSNWTPEDFMRKPRKNTVFYEILDLQKSMVDFSTSVEANHVTLQTAQQTFAPNLSAGQKLWFDNLMLESKQISKMCDLFSEVLDTTSNVAESIVSNTLNDVMKTLTSLTILFSVPTIITAVYTMNISFPSPYDHYLVPIVLMVLFAVLVLFFLRNKDYL